MNRRGTSTWVAVAALCALMATLGAGPAAAVTMAPPESAKGVTITQVDASRYPTVRAAFGADDDKGRTPDFTFYENGEPLSGVSLYNGELGNYEDRRRTDVMLVLDTSLSMGSGTRIDDAVDAAKVLIEHARSGDRIGLATFGGASRVVVEPTAEHALVTRALARVELRNRTTMFDAVSKSAQAFKGDANRAIVLLSDGTDAGSVESLDEAAGEALKANAPIFAIAIRENANDQPRDLAELGNGTSGELRTVTDSRQLDNVFDELGRRILQPFWIEYRSSSPQGSALRFGIGVESRPGVAASMAFRGAPSSQLAAETGPLKVAKPDEPLLPIPGGLLGAFLASLPFAILIFALVWTQLQRRTKPDVIARIERYTTQVTADNMEASSRAVREPLLKRMAKPFLGVSDSFLGRSAFFDRIRARAEQAAIAIKPAELFTAMIANGLLGAIIALVLGGQPLVFALLVPTMYYAPCFWLRMKARKRRNRFEDQLPDVLQAIASSLQAGHSFNQAINAMIKDVPAPTSEEFSRVMTEARLGMPLEAALQHMAERMGSADFDFAVTTVNIQRTVGGSLAEILEMVGDTVRNRQQFRKKVKALTSMGQMSAYVLLAMPPFIGTVLTLLNRDYMMPLYTTPTGHLLLAAGAFSMALGYFACMKVVSVKV